jgi:hypothetical protein
VYAGRAERYWLKRAAQGFCTLQMFDQVMEKGEEAFVDWFAELFAEDAVPVTFPVRRYAQPPVARGHDCPLARGQSCPTHA